MSASSVVQWVELASHPPPPYPLLVRPSTARCGYATRQCYRVGPDMEKRLMWEFYDYAAG